MIAGYYLQKLKCFSENINNTTKLKQTKTFTMERLLKISKVIVKNDYESAECHNLESHLQGNVKYGPEYVYENQKKDAISIIEKFYKTDVRVVSIVKKTKLGMDGLMIELAMLFATHSDDNFVIHRDNIFMITGMSNIQWENDMKEKVPNCFKKNVSHHGKLEKIGAKLKNIKNAVIIIDEVDTGDKSYQMLHILLQKSGVLDLNYMKENNIRFVFVSATSRNQLQELCKWGSEYHQIHVMTVPNSYIGHEDFLAKGIIQEYFPVTNTERSIAWIKLDILDNYADDYRVHIIRTDDESKEYIKEACEKSGVDYRLHTSEERIYDDELNKIFSTKLKRHLVIAIKGFYRRANYIPNEWKLKIGATHERYTIKCDTNVQVQGLPGRMTGYWKKEIEDGHKTGPYRTSIDAINEYEAFYKNPTDASLFYTTSSNKSTFVSPHHIKNLLLVNTQMLRVPVIVDYSGEDKITNNLHKSIEIIKKTLEGKIQYKKLLDFILNKKNECIKIFHPKTHALRNVYITNLIDASNNNVPFNIEMPCSEKYNNNNNWQLYFDSIDKKLCFIICCYDDSY